MVVTLESRQPRNPTIPCRASHAPGQSLRGRRRDETACATHVAAPRRSQPFKSRNYLARPQNGNRTHAASLGDADRLGPDKLGFARWVAVLE